MDKQSWNAKLRPFRVFGAVSTRTELRIVVPNYLSGRSGPHPASGVGDFALGMKQQIGPLPGGFDLSVIVALSLPTGADGISSHGFDPFIKFPWSKDLRAGWSIGGMQFRLLVYGGQQAEPDVGTNYVYREGDHETVGRVRRICR